MASNGVQVTVRVPPVGAFTMALDHANAIMREVANTAEEFAKQDAPVKTGHHKSTIQWTEPRKGEFYVGSQSGYGAPLELGTKHMAAREHILPGIRRAVQEAQHRGDWRA